MVHGKQQQQLYHFANVRGAKSAHLESIIFLGKKNILHGVILTNLPDCISNKDKMTFQP